MFKQKTAYELPMSDWSSDLCSSDLKNLPFRHPLLKPSQAGPSGLAFFLAENPLRFFTSFIFRMRRDIRGLTRVSSVPIFVVTIKLRGSNARRKAGRPNVERGEGGAGGQGQGH